jgi:hypothetical protein
MKKALHSFFSVNVPFVTLPKHELVPLYVPVIEGDATCAVPDTLVLQLAYGASNPPAGMAIDN